MTYAIIPHRLIPGVSGVSSDAQNLSVTNNNAGGFGTAEWDALSAPGLAKGSAVTIGLEGATVFEGKVASVTTGIGEKLSYHVSCVGHFDEFKEDETVEGVFVDRDLNQWVGIGCENWSVWPEGEIGLDTSNGLRFTWPEADKVICYQSETGTTYDHVGNALPHWDVSDFPPAPALWTGAYYKIAGSKTITGLSFEALTFMMRGDMATMQTPDYTNPIGPPDEKYGHRFSKYPKIGYWSDFCGLGHGLAGTPPNAFVGVYMCDDVADLPTTDPVAMYYDGAHLLQRWRVGDYEGVWNFAPRYVYSGKVIVFYAAYLPVRLPFNLGTKYSKNADHLVRTKWVARNRLYVSPFMKTAQYMRIDHLSVYSQGYESGADGSDDLADVFAILFPGSVCDSMPLPAPIDDTAPASIVLRPDSRTLCSAVPELLALYPVDMNYGWWEDGVLTITRDAGEVSIADVPGVDTTGAALSDEGAVDLVQVAFSPTDAVTPQPGQLIVPQTAYLTVDLSGAYDLVPDDWQPAAGQRVAYIDATGTATSEVAAARIGQATAIARRPAQWTGNVNLHAIVGATAMRPGKTLSGAGITDALITSQSINVDGDSVSLSLGNTGYMGRFPARVAGKPLSAHPQEPMGPRPGVTHNRGRSGGRNR